LFADFTNDREFHSAFLQVHHVLSSIALRIDELASLELLDFSRHAGRIEKSLGIEGSASWNHFSGGGGWT
ncbi:MAG: hypothetical protein WA020_14175, partial [Candidatus Acidiferrales bacterium]